MRYISLILLFIIPALSNAQVTTSLQDGGLYYVIVEGDTVSQHTRVDKAIESASNYRDWEIVQDFRLSGSSLFYGEDIIIEEVTDTIYADTVYVNLPPHDNSFLHSVDWTHEVDRETGEERIDFVIKTDEVDSLITEIRCGNEWVKERVFPDAENDVARPANTLSYGILWDCDSDLIYQFRAHKGAWEQAITERFPAFAFELTESEQALIDGVKKKTDLEMGYFSITNDSLLWTNPGHDNAVFLLDHPSVPAEFWNNVSADGGNIRVYFWDGSQEIPVAREVVDVDTVSETGQIYFDSSNSSANTANEWRVYAESGATEPAFSDPLGRDAVWANYIVSDHKADGRSSTGKVNDGVEVGSLITKDVPAIIGTGTSFNGGYINYGNQPLLGDSEIASYSAWVNPKSYDLGGIISQGILQQNNGTGLYVSGAEELRFQAREGGTVATANSPKINLNQWYHVIGVWNGINSKIYLDGVLVHTVSGSLSVLSDIDFVIGASGGSLTFLFNGDVNQARYTHVEISPDYVTTQYNNQSDPTSFWTVGAWEAGDESIEGDASIIETAELTDLSGDLLLSGDSAINDDPEVVQSTATILITGSGSVFDLVEQVDSAGAVLIESTATVDDSMEQIQITGAFEDVVQASAQIVEHAEVMGGNASIMISGHAEAHELPENVVIDSSLYLSAGAAMDEDTEAISVLSKIAIDMAASITEKPEQLLAVETVISDRVKIRVTGQKVGNTIFITGERVPTKLTIN